MPTKIEWCDETWNPLVGCDKASAGCDNCYAIRVAHRGLAAQHRGLTVVPDGTTTPEWNGKVNLVPDLLDRPIRWRRPRRVFVNSLSDLFHPQVPTDYIAKVFAAMALAPHHVFQVLTKRPARMQRLLSSYEWAERVEDAAQRLTATSKAASKALEARGGILALPLADPVLPNVWLGVSVEDNRVAWRADHLRATPAAVRWVSAEPMIGPLDELDLTGMDWIVAGGESGPGARPLHPQWLRDLRDRCATYGCRRCRAGFSMPLGTTCEDHDPRRGPAFHFKQWGDWCPPTVAGLGPVSGTHHLLVDGRLQKRTERLGMDHLLRPVLVTRVGKGKAGRELDGRTWDEWPAGHEHLGEWAPEAGTRN